jgi:hypothetical protein
MEVVSSILEELAYEGYDSEHENEMVALCMKRELEVNICRFA